MAFHYVILSLLPLAAAATAAATIPTNATTFILPIRKDSSYTSPKYYTTLQLGTPPVPVHLAIDLGDPYTWLACDIAGTYNRTSTYRSIPFNSSLCHSCAGPMSGWSMCSHDQPPSLICNHRQCTAYPSTFPALDRSIGYLVVDIMSPLYHRLLPHQPLSPSSLLKTTFRSFPFFCGHFLHYPLRALPRHITGVLTLANVPIALHSQLSSLFKIPQKFAICLPSSSASTSTGVVYFGGGPYMLPPASFDLSSFMVTTRLVRNLCAIDAAYTKGDHELEYYIDIRSILIDATHVKLNSSLLKFEGPNEGGTMVSTIFPYTRLHSAIHKPFVGLFVAKAKAMNVTRVKAVKPFTACFSSKSIRYEARSGVGLPVIDLVMEGEDAVWRIYGSNSMVKVGGGVECLAFVDGGSEVPNRGLALSASVVIGGKQMEDNLVEFDLERSKVGISSSLLRLGTSCSQFKGR